MLGCVKSIVSPSIVTHTLTGYFSAPLPDDDSVPHPQEIIVFTQNVATLYKVLLDKNKTQSDGNYTTTAPINDNENDNNSNVHLRYLSHIIFSSTPVDAQIVRLPGDAIDSVVMSFNHEQVSVIRYHHTTTRTFETIALFHLADKDIAVENTPTKSILRVDPLNRCIAFLSRRRYLFTISIVSTAAEENKKVAPDISEEGGGDNKIEGKDDDDDEWGDEDEYGDAASNKKGGDGSKNNDNDKQQAVSEKTTDISAHDENYTTSLTPISATSDVFGPVKLVDLLSISNNIKYIRDFQFALGVNNDSCYVGFLCEKEPTWAGRTHIADWARGTIQANLLTCCLVCVTLRENFLFEANSTSKPSQAAMINGIPYNATKLLPVPIPQCQSTQIGGVAEGVSAEGSGFIIFAAHSIIHCYQGNALGVFLNRHGEEEAASTRTLLKWKPCLRPQRRPSLDLALTLAEAAVIPLEIRDPSNDGGQIHAALISCPTTGTLHLLSLEFSEQSQQGIENISLVAVGNAPILSTGVSVPTGALKSSLSSSFVFLGSAIGDSMLVEVQQKDGGSGSITKNVKPLPHTVIRNYGPIINCDIGDFSSNDTSADLLYKIHSNDDGNYDNSEYDGQYSRSRITESSPYDSLLCTNIFDPPSMPFVPLDKLLETNDIIAIAGKGKSGQVFTARKSVRLVELKKEALNCISVFFLGAGRKEQSDLGTKRPRNDHIKEEQYLLFALPYSTIILKVFDDHLAPYTCDNYATNEDANSKEKNNSQSFPFILNSRTLYAKDFTVPPSPVQQHNSENDRVIMTVQITDKKVQLIEDYSKVRYSYSSLFTEKEARNDVPSEVGTDLPSAPLIGQCDVALLTTNNSQHLGINAVLSIGLVSTYNQFTILSFPLENSVEFVNGSDEPKWRVDLPFSYEIASFCFVEYNKNTNINNSITPQVIVLIFTISGSLIIGSLSLATSEKSILKGKPNITTFSLVAEIEGFGHLPRVIRDNTLLPTTVGRVRFTPKILSTTPPIITEAKAVKLLPQHGEEEETTLVLMTADGEVVVYTLTLSSLPSMSKCISKSNDASFPYINLFKVHQGFLDREYADDKIISLEERKKLQGVTKDKNTTQETTCQFRNQSLRIVPFIDKLRDISGVYVCGKRPLFLTSNRGKLIIHRHHVSFPTRGFCPISCNLVSSGFVSVGEGTVTFCAFDPSVTFQDDLSVSRHKLSRTPHFIGYQQHTRSVFIVTSEPHPFRPKRASFDMEFNISTDVNGKSVAVPVPQIQHPVVTPDQDIPIPTGERYRAELYSANPWTKFGEYMLEENEEALCGVTIVIRPSQGNGVGGVSGKELSKRITVFAIGTSFPLSEDITCRGRVVLLQCALTPGGKKTVKVIHVEECKGPVTAISSVNQCMAATVGGIVKLFSFDTSRKKLVTLSLLKCGNYTTRMIGFKGFLVIGDLFSSTSLAKVHNWDLSISMLGSHPKGMEITASDIIYQEKNFAIMSGDINGNMVLLSYKPRFDGEGKLCESQLQEEADFRLTAPITSTLRLRIPKANRVDTEEAAMIFYTASSGECGIVHPITEAANRILRLLCDRLSESLPQPAGLHPQISRGPLRNDVKNTIFSKTRMIDGELLNQFMMLSHVERAAISTSIGASSNKVLNYLCRVNDQEGTVF